MTGETACAGPPLELRPKLVWRVLNPALAVALTADSVVRGDWMGLAAAAVFALFSVAAIRNYLRVEGHVIYRRGTLIWYRPLDLDQVTEVLLHRVWAVKEPYPHMELSLVAADRRMFSVSLRWWSDSDTLLRVVARAVSRPSADGRRPPLSLEPSTRRRLARYMP